MGTWRSVTKVNEMVLIKSNTWNRLPVGKFDNGRAYRAVYGERAGGGAHRRREVVMAHKGACTRLQGSSRQRAGWTSRRADRRLVGGSMNRWPLLVMMCTWQAVLSADGTSEVSVVERHAAPRHATPRRQLLRCYVALVCSGSQSLPRGTYYVPGITI